MVTLIHIVKNGSCVSADYFLDKNECDIGYIEYEIDSEKVIQYSYSHEDEQSYVKYGYHKAIEAIKLLVKYNKFPDRYCYIWY